MRNCYLKVPVQYILYICVCVKQQHADTIPCNMPPPTHYRTTITPRLVFRVLGL